MIQALNLAQFSISSNDRLNLGLIPWDMLLFNFNLLRVGVAKKGPLWFSQIKYYPPSINTGWRLLNKTSLLIINLGQIQFEHFAWVSVFLMFLLCPELSTNKFAWLSIPSTITQTYSWWHIINLIFTMTN